MDITNSTLTQDLWGWLLSLQSSLLPVVGCSLLGCWNLWPSFLQACCRWCQYQSDKVIIGSFQHAVNVFFYSIGTFLFAEWTFLCTIQTFLFTVQTFLFTVQTFSTVWTFFVQLVSSFIYCIPFIYKAIYSKCVRSLLISKGNLSFWGSHFFLIS